MVESSAYLKPWKDDVNKSRCKDVTSWQTSDNCTIPGANRDRLILARTSILITLATVKIPVINVLFLFVFYLIQ